MKRLIYQVRIGNDTSLYHGCTQSVSEYCDRYDINHIVQTEPILKILPDPTKTNRSKAAVAKHGCLVIFEKENAFDLLDDYDQIAIIDADILIRNNAPNIFDELDENYDFGAVAECDMPITEKHGQKILAYSRGQYSGLAKKIEKTWKFHPKFGYEFWNMGMMLINTKGFKPFLNGQTAKEFIRRPEFENFINGIGNWKWSTDQTLLNYWIRMTGMRTKNLNWRWNALYNGVEESKVFDAHFVHFFLSTYLGKGFTVDQFK